MRRQEQIASVGFGRRAPYHNSTVFARARLRRSRHNTVWEAAANRTRRRERNVRRCGEAGGGVLLFVQVLLLLAVLLARVTPKVRFIGAAVVFLIVAVPRRSAGVLSALTCPSMQTDWLYRASVSLTSRCMC